METNRILNSLGLRKISQKNYLKKMEKVGSRADDFMNWIDYIGPTPDRMQDAYNLMHTSIRLSRLVSCQSYFDIYKALLDSKIWKNQEANRFIDIGCGNGFLTHAISMKLNGANGAGVDINEPAIEIARSSGGQYQLGNLSFFAMDLCQQMSPSKKLAIGTFDLAISCMVMAEMLHNPKGLKTTAFNLADLIEPGGLFISVERFPDTERQRDALIGAFSAAGFDLKARHLLKIGEETFPLTLMTKKI